MLGGVPARRAVTYGMGPIVAIAGTLALEQGERQSLAQALTGIKAEFHTTDTVLGGISFAMALVGIVGSFPFGTLADRRRRTWLLAGAMGIWTVCMGLNALAPSVLLLYLARLGVGTVEANGPASVSLIADYYPVRNRARMFSLYNLGAAVGGGIGLGLGGVVVGSSLGWRGAFAMWIPFGLLVIFLLLRQPEPARGHQDEDFHDELAEMEDHPHPDQLAPDRLRLPPPKRVGTLDYRDLAVKVWLRELFRIPSMWFGVISITVSSFLLAALGFWGIEFFKRFHGLSGAEAGGMAVFLGSGSGVGLVAGGVVADRLLRRGVVNARVHVIAVASFAATAVMIPGLLADSLWLAGPLFFLSGVFLTLPVGPGEALTSDVVVPQLRGRAAAMRAVVRSLGTSGGVIVGWISDATDLRTALVSVTPLYALGGVIVLFAARHYPADLAFVAAETRRVRSDAGVINVPS